MSLISFHRVLILVAIAFCLGYAGWELRAYRAAEAGVGALVTAGVFTLLAVALGVYLARLRSILRVQG